MKGKISFDVHFCGKRKELLVFLGFSVICVLSIHISLILVQEIFS